MSYVKGYAPWGWVVGTGIYLDDVDAAFYGMARRMGAMFAGIMALLVALSYVTSRGITRQVAELCGVLSSIQETGDLSKRVAVASKDDIGRAATALNSFLAELDGVMSAINATMEWVAVNHLSARVGIAAKGDAGRLKDNINRSLDTLSATLQTVTGSIRQVATATAEVSSAIGQISDGANNQFNALKQVSVAIDQTAQAVVEVADNAHNSSVQSRRAAELVRVGDVHMDSMIEVVGAISASSQQIGKITDVISRIARQTNMLSLNAALEAARAGAHGKGCAVVADEVGRLAENSGKSVAEIVNLIARAANEAARGVEVSAAVKSSIDQIAEGVEGTDRMAAAIAAAIEQQMAAVTEIKASVNDLTYIGESSAAAAEQIAATMTELSRLASRLNDELAEFTF